MYYVIYIYNISLVEVDVCTLSRIVHVHTILSLLFSICLHIDI